MRETHNPTYQRLRYLLDRERRQLSRSDVYSASGVEASIENDQISSVEEGFMQGYLAAFRMAKSELGI